MPYSTLLKRKRPTSTNDSMLVNGINISLKVVYEYRKTVSASMRKNITIRVPKYLNKTERCRQVLKMKEWLTDQLLRDEALFLRYKSKQYKSEDVLIIRDVPFTISISKTDIKHVSARIKNNIILINQPTTIDNGLVHKQTSSQIARQLGAFFLGVLENKIDYYNDTFFKETINKISFKNTISTWGSCSSNQNLNISTRLLLVPDEVLNYVCVHELAHLKQLNHSRHFWNLVHDVMPSYKVHMKWLRKHGDSCRF